jgi:tRNA (guanine-N7-)-methyltransferase
MSKFMRKVRSFVRRDGRSSPAQRLALIELSTQYGLSLPLEGSWDVWFGRSSAKRVLEIGFGMGDALLSYAARDPDTDFLGIEVHPPGVGKVLGALERAKLSNVRVCREDVMLLLPLLEKNSLDAIHIFFPDPWPKTRHHKRRLIQTSTVPLLAACLKTGGILHVASDWEPYAQEILEVLTASEYFKNKGSLEAGFAERSERPTTKFEERGIKLGHVIRDLQFEKLSCPD